MTGSGPLTSVVVVNYETGPLLARCVGSALASDAPVEVLVVDNASGDDSVQQLRKSFGADSRLAVIENPTNVGFARGCNQAFARARGDHVLFLNPDAALPPDGISKLRSALDAHPEAGMAGPLIVDRSGREQVGCRRDLPNPGNALARAIGAPRVVRRWMGGDFVRTGDPLPDGPTEVEAISGSCMLVRRTAIDAVGPFDEGYFLHCEDLDWCARFHEAGLRVLFVPGVRVVHDQGVSSRRRPLFVLWHKHRGMLHYYDKFHRQSDPPLLAALVMVGVGLRFAAVALWTIGARTLSRVGTRP